MNVGEKLDRALGLKVVFEADIPAPTETAPIAPTPPTPSSSLPTKQFYGIYDQTGKRLKGGFTSEAEAQAFIQSKPQKKRFWRGRGWINTGEPLIPDPANVKISPYPNEKTLDVLKSLRRPMDHGWSNDEIVAAMWPYIMKFVHQYPTSKYEKEDLAQQGAMGVLKAIANDKGIADFASHAANYIKGSIDRYINKGGTVGGSEVSGGGGLGQKGGNTGYMIYFRPKGSKQKAEKKFFPADPSAFARHFSKTGHPPPRSLDPNFRAAIAFQREMEEAGYETAEKDVRGGMGSLDAPQGGREGDETSLAASIPAGSTQTPLNIASNRDLVQKLLHKANLSPQQANVIKLLFGLDIPGPGWGDVKSRIAARFGPPESGEEGRAPGTQYGRTPEEAGIDPQQATPEPETETSFGKVATALKLADISHVLGISPEKVRQHKVRALQKLQQAAEAEMSRPADEIEKQVGAAFPSDYIDVANESIYEGLVLVRALCTSMICEMIYTGEINDLILG